MNERGEVRREPGGVRVRFERRFEGTPTELWPYLTESEHLAAWITPGAVIDARVGGRITFPWGSGQPPMEGEITVFDPPRVIEYQWNEGAVRSVVRMELHASGDGTILILDHSGLPDRDAPGFGAGWHSHLDWLAAVRAGAGAEFDQNARFEELAKAYGYEAPLAP